MYRGKHAVLFGICSESNYHIYHLQKGVPDLTPKTRFCMYYPEMGLGYGGSSACWGSSKAGVHWSDA